MRPQAIYPNVDVTSNDASAISGLILLDLAPDGVYQATRVTPRPGGLLPHRFTLTRGVSSRWRFAFCCTFPSLAAGRRYRPSCSLEPGLSSETPAACAAPLRRLPCLPDTAKYTHNRPTIHPPRASLREIQSLAIRRPSPLAPRLVLSVPLAPVLLALSGLLAYWPHEPNQNPTTRPNRHQHSASRSRLQSLLHTRRLVDALGVSASTKESGCGRPAE